MSEPNIYLPYLMRIAEITEESPAVKTFRLEFVDEVAAQNFDFKTGQFGLYSAFGEGESTFCIASSPTRKGYIECTFREVGRVTAALADKEVGDIVGFRGPYGNVFPLEDWKGKNLVFIAGGIALPPAAQRHLELPGPAGLVQGHHRRLRRPQRERPGLQARAEGVERAARHEPRHDRGSRRRDPGLDRARSASSRRWSSSWASPRTTPSPSSAARPS